MAAGVAKRLWEMTDLVEMLEAWRRVSALATDCPPKGPAFLVMPVPAAHVVSVVVMASVSLEGVR